ncbi:MAG: 30S ribosomal protein S20 [Planctomycetes bacterium]|nr:30S ribosomal protein S20 [Planctomycetota bacterium]MBL7008666.1 30S ribosomal protein S20 [Planctomycetota bacterium]
MPNTQSAKGALKRSIVRRELNRGRKSSMRTWIKRTLSAVEEGNKEEAQKCLLEAQRMIDKNVKWHQLHANTGSRRKSRLARSVQAM